jgi:hypothetical protein
VAVVIFSLIEITRHKTGDMQDVLKPQVITGTLIVLGYGAIFLNILFNIGCGLIFLLKKTQRVSKWLIWVNFLLLLVQLFYFFY